MLQSADKKIEEWHGIHCGSSRWREGGVYIQGEIVPEQFQKVHGV